MHKLRFTLFGLVVACGGATVAIDGPDAGQVQPVPTSTTTPPGPPIVGPPTALPPGPKPPPKPPLPPPIGDDDDDVPPSPTSCLDPTPIDSTKIPYRSARPATKGACTAKELTDLGAYYKLNAGGPGFGVKGWMTSVSAGCSACVFTEDTAGTAQAWAPIVVANDQVEAVNRGGCVQIVSGNEACGRSYHQYQTCLVQACLSKCTTTADFNACRGDASVLMTACKAAVEAVKAACGGGESKYELACKGQSYTFDGPIKVACINGG